MLSKLGAEASSAGGMRRVVRTSPTQELQLDAVLVRTVQKKKRKVRTSPAASCGGTICICLCRGRLHRSYGPLELCRLVLICDVFSSGVQPGPPAVVPSAKATAFLLLRRVECLCACSDRISMIVEPCQPMHLMTVQAHQVRCGLEAFSLEHWSILLLALKHWSIGAFFFLH